jgi:hypothetical protein
VNRTLRVFVILLATAGNITEAQVPRISEWVESAPVSDIDRIALGYPVPIPVDTPLPFAGFRSYGGLHLRHQDLADTTPWVGAAEVGTTRQGRSIWAYQLGDADHTTAYGLPEHAMLTNGGIHAREWQSPEVVTGIIELLALSEDDHHLVDYLRDNANILAIPVLNVDGFLQTQRFPRRNWIDTDPDYPATSPRDGRMRRKNMLGVDEDLFTQEDHLLGVDLNRNNAPFWNTNPEASSGLQESLAYHGTAAASEPEIQALDAAAQLGPVERLSMYTDLHSFGQVQLWQVTENENLAMLTDRLLNTFKNHHYAFAAGKFYWSDTIENVAQEQAVGSTDEYFSSTYQVPAWTLEIEPTNGFHDGLPGNGADYGGLGRNAHDGFILPESEIERVRTELAQTFAVAYYQQAGPPSITAMRFIDEETGAVVIDNEWDATGENGRLLHSWVAQPLQFDRHYIFWLAFDKPMRWFENGQVAPLPGQPESTLDFDGVVSIGEDILDIHAIEGKWISAPGGAPDGYQRYRSDALQITLEFPSDPHNLDLVDGTESAALLVNTQDMTGTGLDADPSTAARWEAGNWTGYENTEGVDNTNTGGPDMTLGFPVTSDILGAPFVIEAGTSSLWYDISRNGEGFVLEILSGNRAVMYWFTYDREGAQDWYISVGEVRGNRVLFPDLLRVSGGEFGPGFDPERVVSTAVGSATFIWSSCDTGAMDWIIDRDGSEFRKGRMNLTRLTRVMGIDCGNVSLPPVMDAGRLSGSWFDPTHSGEGYVLEVLADNRTVVYWFSFDAQGNRRWFLGIGELGGGSLDFDVMYTTTGGVFGAEFNPDDVEVHPWGTLELELGCEEGTARFSSIEEGFPAGQLNLTRLTFLDGLSCGD